MVRRKAMLAHSRLALALEFAKSAKMLYLPATITYVTQYLRIENREQRNREQSTPEACSRTTVWFFSY
jgi:hypothetical protein